MAETVGKKPKFQIDLSDISLKPGVYTFIDGKGRVIYVGKAKSLRNRLASYFNATVKNIKTERMLSHAVEVKTIVTENEVEAFLLESNLIKTEMPKYNILLKDSKGYPYVKLTHEEYPRLLFTRNTSDENALFFGPFVNVGDLKQILEVIQRAFPLRTCSNFRLREGKICLKYQIKKCFAPCEGFISKLDYDKLVESVRKFFKGDTEEVEEMLKADMMKLSSNLQFEEAAKVRDRILSLEKLFSKQAVLNIADERSLDLFYKHTINNISGITQVFIRNGKMIGVTSHFFDNTEDDLLERFVLQFYSNVRQFPNLIALEGDEYSPMLEEVLSQMAGKKVAIKKRNLAGILKIAIENAELRTELYLKKIGERRDVSQRLAELVGLEEVRLVECIDISHLQGDYTVGVSVASFNGEFDKKRYRRYRIKTAENNDFQSMKEIFARKGENIRDKSEDLADLYIIDGGIGQLNSVLEAAKQAGVEAKFISISKSRKLRPEKHKSLDTIEQIHLPNRSNPVIFKKNDPLLHFIQHIRDESHRFAITYTRSLALKNISRSPLLEIAGMGAKRLKVLLQAIPDIHTNKDLSIELLHKKGKLSEDLAKKVFEYIENNRKL